MNNIVYFNDGYGVIIGKIKDKYIVVYDGFLKRYYISSKLNEMHYLSKLEIFLRRKNNEILEHLITQIKIHDIKGIRL